MKKRISLLTVLFLCTIIANTQHSGGTSFGLRGGVNFQNINGKDNNNDKLKNDILTGFNVEIPVAPDFYFQPGLLFTTKGAKNKEVFLGQTINSTIKINYVELPLNFLYKPMLGKGHFLLGFGPYVALGTGGKANYDGAGLSRTEDVIFKNTVQLTDSRDAVYFKQLDAGANILAGFEFGNKVSFQMNYPEAELRGICALVYSNNLN
jgi:Outer membrane protein beta-barrel domain